MMMKVEMYNYTVYSMYTVVLIIPEHCWSTIKAVNIVDNENIVQYPESMLHSLVVLVTYFFQI